jgi:DnaK suppressor protein
MAKKKAKKSHNVRKVKKTRRPAKSPKASRTARPRARSVKKPATIKEVVRSAAVPAAKKQRLAPAAPLPKDQLEKFSDVLAQKRDDLLAIVQRKKEEEIEDVGVGDEADVATHSVEKEMLFELTDSEKQTLDLIESALLKIDKGIFGACESCQKAIPRMRLQVMPWARYCVDCQAEQEVPSSE